MNETDFLFTIGRFDFRKVGEISLAGGDPVFELADLDGERGFVYLWVEIFGKTFVVVYVGKAGGTLQERCNQHTGGFKHSPPGRTHADRLRQGISQKKRYFVYARKSETKDILGESDISMACVEELAFIQKFTPSWNAHNKSLQPPGYAGG